MYSTTGLSNSCCKLVCNTSGSRFGVRSCCLPQKNWSVEICNSVSEQPDSFDLDLHDVAGLHEHLRIPAVSDSSWSSGSDHVADFQRHHLRNVGDQIRNFEYQIPSIGFLHRLSVQTKLDVEAVSIA